MSASELLGICAGITAAIQLLGFLAAYALQTEKFYDILGGINFLVLGVYTAAAGGNWADDARKVTCTIIFLVSRSWLLIFLAWRAHERSGDSRFDGVKESFGMFLFYWFFQAIWVFTISMPVVFVNSVTGDPDQKFSVLDIVTISLFAFAVIFEVTADIQKALWVKAGRNGVFCQVGVWRLSRHPNYFAEMLQWWAVWAFSFGSGTGFGDVQWWFAILSPLLTMQILLNTGGTGVMQANGKSLARYYDSCPNEYAEYRDKTSILLPMVGYKYVPKILKRTLFLDFKKYEYRDGPKSE
jgi:steroid 5-alpha reductase family enzyme